MSDWSRWNPVLAGSAAGIASTLVAHPLDTIRTRLQTSTRFTGAIDCARQTVAAEGARALYKGMAFPLVAQAVYKSVMFTAYNGAQSTLISLRSKPSAAAAAAAPLSLGELALCGGLAGGVNTLVVTPVELIRNRLMVQYSNAAKPASATVASAASGAAGAANATVYRGPVHALRSIVATGGVLSLWRGLSVTLLRDMPGVAAFYASNEQAKRSLSSHFPSLSLAATNIIAGACAGVGFWSVALPLDTIKSVVQTDTTGRSATVLLKELLAKGGVGTCAA